MGAQMTGSPMLYMYKVNRAFNLIENERRSEIYWTIAAIDTTVATRTDAVAADAAEAIKLGLPMS